MGRVTTLFARKVAEEVEGGVDKDALLRSVGLERSGSVDPSHMIEDTAYYEFLERAAAVDPRATTLPLRVGAAMRCDDYGAFGLAWKSAPPRTTLWTSATDVRVQSDALHGLRAHDAPARVRAVR